MTDKTKPRGFAVMNAKLQKQIASAGGKRAHELGKAHKFDAVEAAAAGRKGGMVRAARLRAKREAEQKAGA